MNDSFKFARVGVLALLTVVAAWLRFSAIGFGLPDKLRPDEEMIMPQALDFEHDWDPHMAVYPAFQAYVTHAVLRTYASLTGRHGNLREIYSPDDQAQAYRIGRGITAAAGTATVPVLYLASAPIFGPGAAMMSAAIVAVTPIHVRDSKYVKVEVTAALWVALCILMLLRIPSRGRPRDYALAGFFCGLAAATHYPSGGIAISILGVHFGACRREGKSIAAFLCDPRIYLAARVSIGTFLCFDPYFVLDWAQTKHDFTRIMLTYTVWRTDLPSTDFGWRWLQRAIPTSYGFELCLFLVAATLWSIVRPKTGTSALLAFVAICLYPLLGGHSQVEFRYLINPLIAMAIIAGATSADLMSWVRLRIGHHADYAIAAALVLLLVPSAVRDVESNRILSRTDTRTLARIWIVNHIPAGATIVVVNGSLYGRPDLDERYKLVWVDSALRLRAALNTAKWVLSNDFPPLSLWSPGLDDDELEILNSTSQLQFEVTSLKPGDPTPEFDPYDAFYVPFTNITRMSRPGPRIRVWQVTSPSAPFFGRRTDGTPAPLS